MRLLPLYILTGYEDFDSEAGTQLEFKINQRNVCHNITLKNDIECESMEESFLVLLNTSEFRVVVDPDLSQATITINDTNDTDCGECFPF